jgi:hypothetical protein
MSWLLNPSLVMWLITVLYGLSGIANLFARNWAQVFYAVGAVMLNLAVISMGK